MVTPTRLYTAHSRALTTLYSDLESYAGQQREVFIGTAGTVLERANAAGFRFYARQYYDGEGKQRENYLCGPIGDAQADARARDMRTRIEEIKDLVPSLRLLGREGFNLADSRTYVTLASLHNYGVFFAGGMLIGSHAYGVLINQLGVRAAAYTTEDIDIARREALAFETLPEQSFLEMLRDSGIEFVAVPQLDRKLPATSFKQRGKTRFHVDLLAPSSNEEFPVLPVPELKAHASGLPHLKYLLEESQMAMLMAREGCCNVRVPLAERFAVHKLIVSQLRANRGAKSETDVFQACVLLAAMADKHSGTIESALKRVPKPARKYLKPAIESGRSLLETAYPRAWDALTAT